MGEKLYKSAGAAGAGSIAAGIVMIIAGIAAGTIAVISGARMLLMKRDILI